MTLDGQKKLVNERSKKMKEWAQKTRIIGMSEQDKNHKWFHYSSDRNNVISYTVDISRKLICTCKYFLQKNTPCKNMLSTMMKVFNVKESSYIPQQIYLNKKEIKNLFNCCASEKSKSNQKATLTATSDPF